MTKAIAVKQNLLGALEIALFMKKGAQRFDAGKSAMIKSFIIPIILLPLSLLTVLSGHPNQGIDTASLQILAGLYSLRMVISLAAFLGFVYFMAKTMDREEDFNRFVTANNWISIPAAALMLPATMLFLNGNHSWEEIYPLMVFITLYAYAYTGFMATYVMRIPYEMAGFIAIGGLAIHHNVLIFMKWAAVNTLSLLA
ncbi:MAG: hypothetical protein KDI46_06935 [Alphaproteobacteria bacterium]|nr:hypothetical protein [Alphaproteobacteria bacterium]